MVSSTSGKKRNARDVRRPIEEMNTEEMNTEEMNTAQYSSNKSNHNKEQQQHQSKIPSLYQPEIDRLPMKQKEKMYKDLYGLHEQGFGDGDDGDGRGYTLENENDLLWMQNKFEEFEYHLDRVKKKEAYELACLHCPDEIHSPTFIRRFLRAELYDTKLAARRFAKFWDVSFEIWGEQGFKTKFTQDDLSEEDMEALKSGGLRLLPGKDRAGRALMWNRTIDFKFQHPKNMLRALFYQQMIASEDEEVQHNGWVVIAYAKGYLCLGQGPGNFERDLMSTVVKLGFHAFPVRAVSLHHCFDHNFFNRTVVPLLFVWLGKKGLQKYQRHSGSHEDILFALMTYGIRPESIPLDTMGNTVFDEHLQWIEDLRAAGR